MPILILFLFFVVVLLLVFGTYQLKKSKTNQKIINSIKTAPVSQDTMNDYIKKLNIDTMFSDLPKTYSDTGDLDKSLNRMFVLLSYLDDNEEKIKPIIQKFYKNIPAKDFATDKPFGPNWYQWGDPLRRFYGLIYITFKDKNIKTEARNRINILKDSFQYVGGLQQTGANLVLLYFWRVWYQKVVFKQTNTSIQNDENISILKSNLPQIEKLQLVPTEGNLTEDGGYITHTNLRGYGYLKVMLNAVSKINSIINVVDVKYLQDPLYKLGAINGLQSSRIFTRFPANNFYETNTIIGIKNIASLGIITVNTENWSYCTWGNQTLLACAETDRTFKEAANLYIWTTGYRLNTFKYDYSNDADWNWRFEPGAIYPNAPLEHTGTTTTTYVSDTVSMAISSEKFGFILDDIKVAVNKLPVIRRAVFLSLDGIKVIYTFTPSATPINMCIYSGEKITKIEDYWIVDDNIYVYVSKDAASKITYLSSGKFQVLQLIGSTLPSISVNITHGHLDKNFIAESIPGNPNIKDVIYDETNNAYAIRGAKFCSMVHGNTVINNRIYNSDKTFWDSIPESDMPVVPATYINADIENGIAKRRGNSDLNIYGTGIKFYGIGCVGNTNN